MNTANTANTAEIAPANRKVVNKDMELADAANICRKLMNSGMLTDIQADAIHLMMWRAYTARSVIVEANGYMQAGDIKNCSRKISRAHDLLAR